MRIGPAGAAAAALLVLAGCDGSARAPARHASGTHETHSAPRSMQALPPAAALHVQAWAVDDGLLSVLIHNDSSREITSARAVITARDAHGAIVATTSGPSGSLCCTIVGLLPGGTFDVYAGLGRAAGRVSNVAVDYLDVRASAPPATAAKITASHAQLSTDGGLTVVRARLSASGQAGPYLAVQAVLADGHGRLVSVISGRFYCLLPGADLGITMQLFHPVPLGTVVQRIDAVTIPGDVATVTGTLPSCTHEQQ